MFKKVILGTAQLTTDYGVTGSGSALNVDQSLEILRTATLCGITRFDTSPLYGSSQSLLSQISNTDRCTEIYTKLSLPHGFSYYDDIPYSQLDAQLESCLNQLSVSSLDCLYLHDPTGLYPNPTSNSRIIDWLLSIRSQSIVRRCGLSVYQIPEAFFLPRNVVDVIQAPVSIYNQSFLLSPDFRGLLSSGTRLFARSVLLQGLIASDPACWPLPKAKTLLAHHTTFCKYCAINDLSPLTLALQFVLHHPLIDSVVIGVRSAIELSEISNIQTSPSSGLDLDSWDLSFSPDINPSTWT